MGGFTNFSLDPFDGTFDTSQAAHLLRRTMYGPTGDDIEMATSQGLEATLDMLLEEKPAVQDPINFNLEDDPNTPIGTSWVGKPFDAGVDKQIQSRQQSLAAWTIGLALEEGISIREKMTLFWRNHFVVSDINEANYLYTNISLYRNNFLGNFKTLTEETTINSAMLRYLNGNQNTDNAPNENYARELLELFTIGKGPLAGEDDYTHYTEHDIREIAKILTGWRDLGYFTRGLTPYNVVFFPNRHDTSTKTLSHRFNNSQITNMGDQEYKFLIDIIFQQEEVSRFIARKIYRWFVYYDITDEIEIGVIEPMAKILRDADYEMYPMVRALLASQHFFDEYAKGSLIKNPVDFIAGQVKQLNVDFGDNIILKYNIWRRLYEFSAILQMNYFQPPSVAGWKAYHQEPLYYRTWINASTISNRYLLAVILINGIEVGDLRIQADLLDLISEIESVNNPDALINALSEIFLTQPLTENQVSYLKSILIPGLPDYEWTLEYDAYLSNTDDTSLKTAIENRLKALFTGLVSLPEYQLS